MADARVIDGRALAARLTGRVAAEVARLNSEHGITPALAVVLVGDDPASHVYVRSKNRALRDAGMRSLHEALPADTPERGLLDLIARLNADGDVHGILVQLPLPGRIDAERVLDAVDPAKDVDGFHAVNAGRLAAGAAGAVAPCTPQGCLMLIKEHVADLAGLKAVVVGRSRIVGRPMAALLLGENCTVTMAHSRTRDLAAECRAADILVAATGQPEMIKGGWIKPGAVVIDVGINRIENGPGKTRLVGDVDFDGAVKVAGALTPVPGGVGPMTIACVLRNTLLAACRQNGLSAPDV